MKWYNLKVPWLVEPWLSSRREFMIIHELITIKSEILQMILMYQRFDLNGIGCKATNMSIVSTPPINLLYWLIIWGDMASTLHRFTLFHRLNVSFGSVSMWWEPRSTLFESFHAITLYVSSSEMKNSEKPLSYSSNQRLDAITFKYLLLVSASNCLSVDTGHFSNRLDRNVQVTLYPSSFRKRNTNKEHIANYC